LTGRTQGILDRCLATSTCPKIVHAATALELWELRQSLGFTPPKLSTGHYGNLVAQVDADGNDLGGIRDVFVAVGTYTGWNQFNKNFFENGFCTLSGSFIPFAPTRQERLAIGDSRRSIEERYPTKRLCCSLQEGSKRPRCPTLPVSRRCHPADLGSGA
jgi:hypothetical protein